MKKLKIVTIGGGSSYTPELIEGFIQRKDELPIAEIWLVDVEAGQERLETIGELSRRMIHKAGLDIKVITTLDRRSALRDADFVTTQFRVGQLKARALDESISNQFNQIGQETNGAGGMFKGLRTIPVILDICKDIEELCPQAWMINFTNPSGMITEAILSQTKMTRVIGLCNNPINMQRAIASGLGVDVKDLYVEFVGLNHMVFVSHVDLKGEDITEQVVEGFAQQSEKATLKNITALPFDPDFIRALKLIPCDYLRYYYKHDAMLEHQLAEKETRAQVVQGVEHELFELYKDLNLDIKPKQLEHRGGAYYSEAACNLISSLYNDTRDIQTVNTRNRGAIRDIDADSAVEVNCVITKAGPIPLVVGELPLAIKGLVQQIKSFEKLTVEAAVTGNTQTALLALVTNPLTGNDTDAHQLLNALLKAHQSDLPQFFK